MDDGLFQAVIDLAKATGLFISLVFVLAALFGRRGH